MTQTVDEVNAAAHPNAREARVITDQIATCPFDGGPGASVYFALSEERAVAGDLSYVGLYRRMVDGILRQRDLGLPVFDLGDVFVDVRETVYGDGFHLIRSPFGESLGYRLMARRVAADVAAAWGLKRKRDATR